MLSFSALPCLLALFSAASLPAQTFGATTGTEGIIRAMPEQDPRITVPGHHPHTDENLMYGRVRDGVYTVDGMVAKLKLNYDVDGARFLYLFVPGAGTAVLSLTPAPDAVNTEASLKDNELSFTADGHRFQLSKVAIVNDKGNAPAHLYAHLDSAAWDLAKQPMVGFGNVAAAPYLWPGSLPAGQAGVKVTEAAIPTPPVPVSLLPSRKPVKPAVSAAVRPVAMQPAVAR